LAEYPPRLVIALVFDNPAAVRRLRAGLNSNPAEIQEATLNADLPMRAMDGWCPREATSPLYGARPDAEMLTGAARLREDSPPDFSGAKVNVVVVDEGVDNRLVPAANRGPGWKVTWPDPNVVGGWKGTREPGTAWHGHGAMVTRNVLALAPSAWIHDCPMLPDAIQNVDIFLSVAQAAFDRLILEIPIYGEVKGFGNRWVVVNAWGIYDARTEHEPGSYTRDRKFGHEFNKAVAKLETLGADILFAAGNCGLLCPNKRCGPLDRGPGQSILGANAHPKVLSVGAVRVDGRWLGYSSQGPGAPVRWPRPPAKSAGSGDPDPSPDDDGYRKPDLCAPSNFAEIRDAAGEGANSGTSAAVAFTAGVMAALRSGWAPDDVTPAVMRETLADTARRPRPPDAWNREMGWGILDIPAAVRELAKLGAVVASAPEGAEVAEAAEVSGPS
jgi:hypothetical protein